MPIIVEGNVSKHILSFSHGEFIFTAPVCKSWNANASCRGTSSAEALQSLSRVKEMDECGRLPMLWCAHSLLRAVQVSRNVEVLQFLESKGVPFAFDSDDYKYETCERLYGDGVCADHVKFLLESKLGTIRQIDLIMAIRAQQIDVAELLIEYGCPLAEDIIDYALMSCRLGFAKRLVLRGCMVQRSAYFSMFEEIWWNEEAVEFDFRPSLDWVHSMRRPFDFKGLEEMMKESRLWRDIFADRPEVQYWFDEKIVDYHMTRVYNQCAKRKR